MNLKSSKGGRVFTMENCEPKGRKLNSQAGAVESYKQKDRAERAPTHDSERVLQYEAQASVLIIADLKP